MGRFARDTAAYDFIDQGFALGQPDRFIDRFGRRRLGDRRDVLGIDRCDGEFGIENHGAAIAIRKITRIDAGIIGFARQASLGNDQFAADLRGAVGFRVSFAERLEGH